MAPAVRQEEIVKSSTNSHALIQQRVNNISTTTEVREFEPLRVRPLPHQPRKRFRNINELAQSIKLSGQHTPGLVSLIDGDAQYEAELIDGERRLRACTLAGVSFRAEVRQVTSYQEKYMLSLTKNFGREDHTSTEIATALARAVQGGETPERLSVMLGKSITWVIQHLNLNKLDPKVFAMLEEAENSERRSFLNFSTAQTLLNLPQKEQRIFARRIQAGDFKSLEQLRRTILQHASRQGVRVAQRERSPENCFQDFSKLADKSVHRFGVYVDMTADKLNGMIAAANPKDLEIVLATLSTIVTDVQGLHDAIKHRAGRMRFVAVVRKSTMNG